ncbi:MAG: DUF1667 domain-containing protein [Halanaerobiales bacterium]
MSRTNIICVNCPKGCRISIETNNGEIEDISGYECKSGKEYAFEEFKNPTRVLPTTVRVVDGVLPLVSVKTSRAIPKNILLDAMREIAQIEVEAPVKIGDVIVEDFMNTGVELVATRSITRR